MQKDSILSNGINKIKFGLVLGIKDISTKKRFDLDQRFQFNYWSIVTKTDDNGFTNVTPNNIFINIYPA